MGTLSKVGFAGARVGYVRLPGALAHEVDKARQPYNLSSLAQTVGILALTELAPVLDAQVAAIVAERGRVESALARIEGLSPLPSRANFILVRSHRRTATEVTAELRDRGVGVRSFGEEGPLAGHVRVTIGTAPENDRLLDALAAI
jgi:histidinol-phosphate/aromatic aminotransferase/cobyric acid decarboxylase-like protein